MSHYRLQLEQASSAFTLPDAQAREDFREALTRGADAVGFTEINKRAHLLREACDAKGYVLVAAGDVGLAVRSIHRLTDHGVITSVPGQPGPASEGGHTERPILWASFIPFGTGELVTAHVAHWVTHAADTGHQQLAMTRDMADAVAEHSKGHRLGFWLGDTNNPDRATINTDVDKALRRGDLTSCWDELGRYPDTHGASTLDVVGSYDPDRRATCVRARVWPSAHSDHLAVSAWYSVSGVRPPS